MCYNSTMSYTFFAIGILVSLYIYNYSKLLRSTYIHYIIIFYSLMELLQGTQYFHVNECTSEINRNLTNIAYILVIVQPLMWNLFFYINSKKEYAKVFMTGIVFALIWMVINILGRLSYDKNTNPQTKDMSIYATDTTCTKKRKTHVYWEWTSANFKDLTANFLMYLMIWFIPSLVVPQFRYISFVLISGALAAALTSYLNGEYFIFTSLWCYISIPLLICIVIFIKLFNA